MSTLTAPTTALDARSRLVAAYARAFDRAIAAKLVAYHNRAEDTYAVPSTSQPGEYHTVRHNGSSDWAGLSCTCKAASHPACLHRAITAFFRARHISASPVRCSVCDDRFCNGNCPLTTPTEPRETPYEAPAGEGVLWEAEQARMDAADSYADYLAECAAETETDEEPPLAVQEDAQLLAMERSLHPVQRPAPLPAAWVPSAGVGFVRAVTLDGASPAYRASLEADAAAIVAAAVRDYGPDPLADLWS